MRKLLAALALIGLCGQAHAESQVFVNNTTYGVLPASQLVVALPNGSTVGLGAGLANAGGGPGGTQGQIQWNNSSALAGFTLATGQIMLGGGTSTPSTLTAINGDCIVGAGGVWTAAACGGGSSGLTVGTTTITSGTNNQLLFNNAGVLGNEAVSSLSIGWSQLTGTPTTLGGYGIAVTGTGNAVQATSPTLTTPNLGTPSAVNLTNATSLPCGALPALTGGVTSTAGQCATTLSTTVQFTTFCEWHYPSATSTSLAAGTYQCADPFPFTAGTVTTVNVTTSGTSPAFTVTPKIGSTTVTGCTVTVSATGLTTANCTAANTLAKGNVLSFVVSGLSGTITDPVIQVVYTRTFN